MRFYIFILFLLPVLLFAAEPMAHSVFSIDHALWDINGQGPSAIEAVSTLLMLYYSAASLVAYGFWLRDKKTTVW